MKDQSPAPALDSRSTATAPEANWRLERDPTEQAILATLRELLSKGYSLRRVASALNREGYRTRRDSEWRLESVARVIRRESFFPPSKIKPPKSPI